MSEETELFPTAPEPEGSDASAADDAYDTEAAAEHTAKPTEPTGHPPMGSEGMQTSLSTPQQLSGESWDDARERLAAYYPAATDGVLFCVYKLLQDPECSLRDFRDEAATRGVGLSGRSLHSAKVLLGKAEPATRRPKKPAREEVEDDEEDFEAPAPRPRAQAQPAPATRRRAPRAAPAPRLDGTTPVEEALRKAVQQMQDAAQAENDRLRDAIREAIDVLRSALDD